MSHSKFKSVTIGDQLYQVGKLDVFTAAWILSSLVAASSEVPQNNNSGAEKPQPVDFSKLSDKERQEYADGTIAMLWTLGGSRLPRTQYREIQVYALKCCNWQSPAAKVFEPVMMADGRWAKMDLQDDAKTVTRLIVEVLQFNLSPVFQEDAFPPNPSGPDTPPQNASK